MRTTKLACTTSVIAIAAVASFNAAGDTMRPTFDASYERAKIIEKVACAP